MATLIGEFWMDGDFDIRDQFFKTYFLAPRLPAMGGYPCFLPMFAQCSTIRSTNLCPIRYPPLQITKNLQKIIDKIYNRIGGNEYRCRGRSKRIYPIVA